MAVFRSQQDIAQVAGLNYVEAASVAVAADIDLFTIDDGNVILLGFWGEVVTEIGAGSQDIAMHLDPDDGGSNVILADATTPLAIDGDVTGTIITLNTTFGGDFVATLDYATNAMLATPILLVPGDLHLDVTGTEAGAITWTAVWRTAEKDGSGVLTAS